ncbi:MAG: KH domain-containing protein [Pseudomonadota bacterium]|nr:KH domain-containing protein [Pseudomonadota bacterium]
MKAVVDHLVRGLVRNPDAVRLNTVEGEASVLIELTVAPEDVARIKGPEGDTLRAIRTVLSASAGRRKAVLELLEPGASSGEE